jgi:hypothetical protein
MHAGRERSFDPALSDPTPTRKGKLKMNATTVSWPHPLRCGPVARQRQSAFTLTPTKF